MMNKGERNYFIKRLEMPLKVPRRRALQRFGTGNLRVFFQLIESLSKSRFCDGFGASVHKKLTAFHDIREGQFFHGVKGFVLVFR